MDPVSRTLLALMIAACGDGAASDDVDAGDDDADGFTNGEERACGSDGADAASTCYACGWSRGDPGDLVATGAAEGDTIANLVFVDPCDDEVPLWDFAGEYRILFVTTAW